MTTDPSIAKLLVQILGALAVLGLVGVIGLIATGSDGADVAVNFESS